MMFDLNQQRVSETRTNIVPDFLVMAMLAMVLILGLGPAPWATAAAPASENELMLTGPAEKDPSPQMAQWLAEDQAWLASLPDREKSGPALSGSEELLESLNIQKSWVLAQVADDSLAVVLPVASRLRERWLDRGYLAVKVSRKTDSNDPEALGRGWTIDPGLRYSLAELVVEGPEFPGRDHLLRLWLPETGKHFLAGEFEAGITRILQGAGENGYPFARWVTSDLQLDPVLAQVKVRATLLPGYASFIGPVVSDLPQDRAARFLAKASGLRPGHPFRQSDLNDATGRLLARDLYTSVGTPVVFPTASTDTVGIYFPVVPRHKVNRLQVVLGLSRKQEDGPSRLSGEVDLRLPNMAGTGRNLGINWRDDGNLKKHFGLEYLEPMAFGTPLDMAWAVDSVIEEENYTRLRLDNRWQLPVVALWGVELGVGWDRSTYPQGELESSKRTRARGAFLHRRGDRTRSGWSGLFALETAWRSSRVRPLDDGQATTVGLGEALTQRIYEVDTAGELWLGHTFSLAARASFRQLSGSDEIIPLSEQFRFGGAASLRGYREDEFNGAKAAWGGVEMRIGSAGRSRLYTFYDLGYFGFSSTLTDNSGQESMVWKKGWPKGYGLGLLARTTAGDISLAIGFPGTVDFEQAKLHVTLMESF